MLKIRLAGVSLLLFSLLCHQPLISQEMVAPTPPSRVYYSVFVQSFCDSNGDGIGDIPGLTSKLDYLKDLGIGGLWLLPVHPSPSYHKYDVADYYSIHPDYGTLEDYKTLVKEAHKRGMVILLDLVLNHTSDKIQWFKEAAANPKSKYRNYYLWSTNKADFQAEPFHWHAVRDAKQKELPGPKYYGFFWWTMPDLNYDNPDVRQEVHRIASFWLKDIGIDGFRLDAARYIYPENQVDKTLAWWKEFRDEASKIKKDAFIVAEVWGPSKEVAPYLKNGMSACFNFQLADSIRASVKDENDHYVLQTWYQIRDNYKKQTPDYEDAVFLSNHDMNRIMTDIGNKTEKARVAAALLLTLPGNPFIYYGEEIGMLGEKPDEFIREPFLWNMEGEDKGQTTWEKPWRSTSQTVKPLRYQTEDEGSLYHFYRNLIKIRNNNLCLSQGGFHPYVQGNRKVLAYYRGYQKETVMVLINLSNSIQRIESPDGISGYTQLFSTHNIFKSGGGAIFLQPYSVFILSRTNQ